MIFYRKRSFEGWLGRFLPSRLGSSPFHFQWHVVAGTLRVRLVVVQLIGEYWSCRLECQAPSRDPFRLVPSMTMNSMPWLQLSSLDRLQSMVDVSILANISLARDGISICRNPVSWKIGGYNGTKSDDSGSSSRCRGRHSLLSATLPVTC